MYARAAVVVVSDGQQFVDGRQVPALALVAAPLESRKIIPRKVVFGDIGGYLLHISHAVDPVVGARNPQVGLPEFAPRQVYFVERNNQSVPAVLRQHADHALDAVLVVELADLILFGDILHRRSLLYRRLRSGSRCDRSLTDRRRRGQRRRRHSFGSPEALLFAVGILNVVDIGDRQHIGRSVGIGETLIPYCIGCYFGYFGLDLRRIGLDDQVLSRGRQYAAKRCHKQQNRFFHHR